MNVDTWLKNVVHSLEAASIGTARLDCLVLLEDATSKDRSWLLAHPETELEALVVKKLETQIARRAAHEPLAYIRGKSEFYGREFTVNKHTLEPRPETETMIDLLLKTLKSHFPSDTEIRPLTDGGNVRVSLIDIGTGSGCIAVTAKLEMPGLQVMATDIDVECIRVARKNAAVLGAEVIFYEGNLLEPIKEDLDIVLCNLPYVPEKYELNQAAKFEPRHAIFSGEDGLDLYRELFTQIAKRPKKPKHLLTESLPFQHEALAKIADRAGYNLTETDDFIQAYLLA